MIEDQLARITPPTERLDSGDGLKTGYWFGFSPNEDTVITSCTGRDADGNSVNYLTDTEHKLGVQGETLTKSELYEVPYLFQINSIQITSGSVTMFKLSGC